MLTQSKPTEAASDPMEAASALVLELRERTREINELGRLPEDIVQKFDQAGLFSLTIPHQYGGSEVDWRTYMDVLVEIGRGNGSASWVLAIINTVNWMVAAMFAPSVAETVFQSPGGVRTAGVQTPRKYKIRKVEGGIYIEYGLWPFNSGVYHANWDALGVPSFDAEGNEIALDCLALLPADKVTRLNDWNVTAMRGTGSTTVTVENLFVPDEYIASISDINREIWPSTQLADQPSYRSSFLPVFTVTLGFPVLGMGYAALELFIEQMKTKKILYSRYDWQKDAPVTHLQLGEASAKLDACKYLLRNVADEIQAAAERGHPLPSGDRARLKRDVGFSNRMVCEAVDLLATALGASLGAASNPFTSVWQDIRVGHLHAFLAPNTNLETYGRHLVGLDAGHPFI
ncbi:acyl-CoA dehydrogenase family protein [Sphingomonas sp. YL-JM2C]